jgi:hypothetical protein
MERLQADFAQRFAALSRQRSRCEPSTAGDALPTAACAPLISVARSSSKLDADHTLRSIRSQVGAFSWHTCLSCVARAGFNKLLKPLRMLNHRCGANEKEEQEDNVRLQYQVMVVIHDVHSPKRRRRFGCAFRRRCCCHCCSKLNHDCTFGLSNLRRIRMILTYERRIGLHG